MLTEIKRKTQGPKCQQGIISDLLENRRRCKIGLCVYIKDNLKLTFKLGDETVEVVVYRNKIGKFKLNIFAKTNVKVTQGRNEQGKSTRPIGDDDFGNK